MMDDYQLEKREYERERFTETPAFNEEIGVLKGREGLRVDNAQGGGIADSKERAMKTDRDKGNSSESIVETDLGYWASLTKSISAITDALKCRSITFGAENVLLDTLKDLTAIYNAEASRIADPKEDSL